jgi:UDP-N-acetylglucosamine 2-epimerase
MPAVWFWPNPDAGTGEMAETLRHFREQHEAATERMRFITDLPVDRFISLLKRTACLVGNSSAGIKECSYLGTPVVDIGKRQEGRLRGENVLHAGYDVEEIRTAINRQMQRGRYPSSNIYYREGTSQAIVDVLARVPLYTQKRFHENVPAGARVS